jgi:uncharacterized repeat protein (TIGR02543 family)
LIVILTLGLFACGNDNDLESFTISFDSDGGSEVEPITVLDGGYAKAPTPPTKENYDFLGWYIGDTEYTFGVAVVRDLKLTAKWTPKEYELTFDSDNGEGVFTLISTWGEDFTVPLPKRDGYNFDGWYKGDERFDFDSISENVSLKARWISNSGGLEFTLSEDEKSYTVTGCGDFKGDDLIIPSHNEGKPVIAIADNAFYDTSIVSVRIPGTVKKVGFMAFAKCTSLKELTIDDGTDPIDSSFYGCTSLSSVTLANSIRKLDNAFRGCTSLTSVTLPDSTVSANNAFQDCSALVMNESEGGWYLGTATNPYHMLMTVIDKSVTSFKINEKTVIIHTAALMDCTALAELSIPSSVKYIYGNAFMRCTSLTTVIIPSSVTTIASFAFSDCENLKTVYVPYTVTEMGYHAFEGCLNVTVSCAVSKAPDGWDPDWDLCFLEEEIVQIKVVWGSGAIG